MINLLELVWSRLERMPIMLCPSPDKLQKKNCLPGLLPLLLFSCYAQAMPYFDILCRATASCLLIIREKLGHVWIVG
jgi:hypothetical protein